MQGNNSAIAHGLQARGMRGSIDEAHLSRDVADIMNMKSHTLSTLFAFDHAEFAGDDDMQRVIDFAVVDEVLIGVKPPIIGNFSYTPTLLVTQVLPDRRIFDICLNCVDIRRAKIPNA